MEDSSVSVLLLLLLLRVVSVIPEHAFDNFGNRDETVAGEAEGSGRTGQPTTEDRRILARYERAPATVDFGPLLKRLTQRAGSSGFGSLFGKGDKNVLFGFNGPRNKIETTTQQPPITVNPSTQSFTIAALILSGKEFTVSQPPRNETLNSNLSSLLTARKTTTAFKTMEGESLKTNEILSTTSEGRYKTELSTSSTGQLSTAVEILNAYTNSGVSDLELRTLIPLQGKDNRLNRSKDKATTTTTVPILTESDTVEMSTLGVETFTSQTKSEVTDSASGMEAVGSRDDKSSGAWRSDRLHDVTTDSVNRVSFTALLHSVTSSLGVNGGANGMKKLDPRTTEPALRSPVTLVGITVPALLLLLTLIGGLIFIITRKARAKTNPKTNASSPPATAAADESSKEGMSSEADLTSHHDATCSVQVQRCRHLTPVPRAPLHPRASTP